MAFDLNIIMAAPGIFKEGGEGGGCSIVKIFVKYFERMSVVTLKKNLKFSKNMGHSRDSLNSYFFKTNM